MLCNAHVGEEQNPSAPLESLLPLNFCNAASRGSGGVAVCRKKNPEGVVDSLSTTQVMSFLRHG